MGIGDVENGDWKCIVSVSILNRGRERLDRNTLG